MKSLKYFSSTFSLIFSSLAGSLLGMITSLMVNCTLLEISMNSIFSIYFGMIFVIVGALILWRSLLKDKKNTSDGVIFRNKNAFSYIKQTKRNFFIILSLLVILSGFTSFLLDQSWFLLMNYIYKIPIYSLLGISICFTLAFLIIDVINHISLNFQSDYSKPVVSSHNQYSFILTVSCVLGSLYGLIFGVMDLEDLSKIYLKATFIREQNYCIPIGLGFGCITGYMNEYIRNECDVNAYASEVFYDEDVCDLLIF